MNLLTVLAGFTLAGRAGGAVEVTHYRCGTSRVFGLDGRDVTGSEAAIWMRDHRCPEEQAPVLSRMRVLAGVA